jgi:integrase
LLTNAAPGLRPSIAIAAFAGLRPAEIHRLRWEAVDLKGRLISVSARTSKTASRRLVPICDNLIEWLMQAPKKGGAIVPPNERKLSDAARIAAGIENWPHDALRHSWVSYRFALTGDAAKTASEAGHDQQVLHRHYKALVTRGAAEAWFSIIPGPTASAAIPFEPNAESA